jgi:hypothetical protein
MNIFMKKIFFYTIIFCSVFGLPAAERVEQLASVKAAAGKIWTTMAPTPSSNSYPTGPIILSLIDRIPTSTDARSSIRIKNIENNEFNNLNKLSFFAQITHKSLQNDKPNALGAEFFLHGDFSNALAKRINENTEVCFQLRMDRSDDVHIYFFSMPSQEVAKKFNISLPEEPIFSGSSDKSFSTPSNNSFGSFSVPQAIIFTIIPIATFFLGYWCALHHSSLENFFKKNIDPI